jgi:hypothetical protein
MFEQTVRGGAGVKTVRRLFLGMGGLCKVLSINKQNYFLNYSLERVKLIVR